MRLGFAVLGAAIVACSVVSAAPAADMPIIAGPKDVKWGPAPPMLPPGAQLAVMAGDPSKPGFLSLRVKIPAGYIIPPHTHPTDEHVTVLSGTMAFGMGDKVTAKAEKTVGVGGYFIATAMMHHFAVARTAAILQVDLEGPFQIDYINPADDPRHKK